MARIDALPSLEIIRGLKGILDFYVWNGLPCVRAWPKYRPAKQTAASLAAALVFGAIVKSYSLLANVPLEAYREDALDQPRTARDIMVTGIYGNLHEASMSHFLDLLVECRDFLSDLTTLLDALHSIDTDELVVRTEHSVLPDGAATFARQTSILTRVTEIADLQDALESKALDRLLVRGMDQLPSYAGRLFSRHTAVISGPNGFIHSHAPPPGEVWIVTTVASIDSTSPTTAHFCHAWDGATAYALDRDVAAFAVGVPTFYHGNLWLDPGDLVRVDFGGSLADDLCSVYLIGHRMTLET